MVPCSEARIYYDRKMNAPFKMSFICCPRCVFSPCHKPCLSAETSSTVTYVLMKRICTFTYPDLSLKISLCAKLVMQHIRFSDF